MNKQAYVENLIRDIGFRRTLEELEKQAGPRFPIVTADGEEHWVGGEPPKKEQKIHVYNPPKRKPTPKRERVSLPSKVDKIPGESVVRVNQPPPKKPSSAAAASGPAIATTGEVPLSVAGGAAGAAGGGLLAKLLGAKKTRSLLPLMLLGGVGGAALGLKGSAALKERSAPASPKPKPKKQRLQRAPSETQLANRA